MEDEKVLKTFNSFLLNGKRQVIVTVTDKSLIIGGSDKIPIYNTIVNVIHKRKVDFSYVLLGIVLFLIGVASEFYGGVVNIIGHISIFLGLVGIGIGVRRRMFCAEIQYPQGKINLCSKNNYDPSLLAVCINKIKGGASEC
jgi:hypothetical protein